MANGAAAQKSSGPVPDHLSSANGLQRQRNETLRFPLTPEGFNYEYSSLFPFSFQEPVDICSPPGETNRLFIVERSGRIKVVPDLTQPAQSTFLDISDRVFREGESGLLSMAFHPKFASNGYFYVVYTFSTNNASEGLHTRLSRFQLSSLNINAASVESEQPLITQFDGDPYHQGGDLAFGPDGYLYISFGDGGLFSFSKIQQLDQDFFGGILRIDVDRRAGNLKPNPHPGITEGYAIPADNPFVNAGRFNGLPVDASRVRTEYYAVGLRNPWRFSFDPLTGELYSNDTGSNYREEINLIQKGANYGWPFDEGSLQLTNFFAGAIRPSSLLPPMAEYGYADGGAGSGKSIAGGILYRGSSLPQLEGAYIFADFWTGDIGMVRPPEKGLLIDLRELQTTISKLEEDVLSDNAGLLERQAEWENLWREKQSEWTVLEPLSATALSGVLLEPQADQSLLAKGDLAWSDIYTVRASTRLTDITAIRLELVPDPSLPNSGPGRSAGGNIILSEVQVSAAPADGSAPGSLINLKSSSADYSQPGWNIEGALDGRLDTGWAIAPAVGTSHEAVFELEEPTGFKNGTIFYVILKHAPGTQASVGRFRLSASTVTPPPLADSAASFREILLIPPEIRSQEQKQKLFGFYRSIDPEIQSAEAQIAHLRQKQAEILHRMTLPIEWIMRAPGVASFSVHPASGRLLMVDMINGYILDVRRRSAGTVSLPPTLRESGIFSDLETLAPHPGIVPYTINVPFWSDNAIKQRWFSLPDPNKTFGFSREGNWLFPPGTVWIKHFDLETTNGVPSSIRRMETRVLVRHEYGVYGATYRWDRPGRNAYLVPDEGLNDAVVVQEGRRPRAQIWRYPSRAECLQCHTTAGGYALGFNTAQLNRPATHGPLTQNQIEALNNAGYFSAPVTNFHTLPALAASTDEEASVEFRIRSYLQANCVQCHQPGATGRSLWDARASIPRQLAGLIDAFPIHGASSREDRLIKPGSLENSVLWQRLSNLNERHMPPLGSTLVNTEAVALLSQWITNDLPNYESYSNWRTRLFLDDTADEAAEEADPDSDGVSNYVEYLTRTDPLQPTDRYKLSVRVSEGRTYLRFVRLANLGYEIQWATNPYDSSSWKPLDAPGNTLFYAAKDSEALLEDPHRDGQLRFYRLIVREP